MKTTFPTIAGLAVVLAACSSMSWPNESSEPEVEASAEAVTEPAEEAAEAVQAVEEAAVEPGICVDAGPQTPRDISSTTGLNLTEFPLAPAPSEMNLCNIHTHTNAEHKGPGFSVFVDATDHGGYACNATSDLTEAELTPAPGAFKGVGPGQTIEVHWVHTSCDATPGEGLGACVPEGCTDPLLRVEAQTFLVVNDASAASFMDYAYGGNVVGGKHQAKAIPASTGTPVSFRGSTTGPSYTQEVCSPAQVTWSVRPDCMKLDINSLHEWAESDNVFKETKSHGVRQLVTAPELLSPIE